MSGQTVQVFSWEHGVRNAARLITMLARWSWVLVLWWSCQVPASTEAPEPLNQPPAREVKADPPGCLAAFPVKQTLEGNLRGVVLAGAPEEDPPIPKSGALLLSLKTRVAVCAAPREGYPAYEDVTVVGLSNLSLSDLQYVMHRWGADDIRITSTLDTAQTFGQALIGPVIFDSAQFEFCWRRRSNPKQGAWKCMDATAWGDQLPGPHLD